MGERSDVDEVTGRSDDYEDALRANDVDRLDGHFADDDRVVRFGVAEVQYGKEAVVAWRATAPPIDPSRRIVRRDVTALADGVVAVDLTFVDADASVVGRQSQTWIRTDAGWKILRAHVSIVPAPT